MYLFAAYSVAVAAWTLAANFGQAPHSLPIWINGAFYGDKVVHFFVVGLFAVFAAHAIRSAGLTAWRSLALGMALAILLSSVEEATNAVLPNRCCSFADLLANYAGVVFMGSLVAAWLAGPRLFAWRPLTFGRAHAYVG